MTSLGRVMVLIRELEEERFDAANPCGSAAEHRILDFPSRMPGDSALGPTLVLIRELQETQPLRRAGGTASKRHEMAQSRTGDRRS